MTGLYILDGKTPVRCDNVPTWARWDGTIDHRVARDERNGVTVSTVFLGIDRRFSDDGPPLLFETMIFGGPYDREAQWYSTWDEAEKGHAEMCAKAFEEVKCS